MIDHNAGQAQALRKVLQEAAGKEFSMEWTEKFNAGMEMLGEDKFDVVLLSLSMPDKSGVEVLKELRKFDNSVPVDRRAHV